MGSAVKQAVTPLISLAFLSGEVERRKRDLKKSATSLVVRCREEFPCLVTSLVVGTAVRVTVGESPGSHV